MWGYQKEFVDGTSKPQKAPPLAPGLYAGEDCRQLALDSIHRVGRQIDGTLWIRLVRTSIVQKHGLRFHPSLKIYDDTLLAWQIHACCSRVFSMGDQMYAHYLQNEHSITHSYLPSFLDTVLKICDMLLEFYKANGLYTDDVQTRVNWSRLYLITKAVKQEKFRGGTQEEMTKAVDAVLSDPRVRNAVAQVDSKTGTELFGERYELMRDKRSWELLNAKHL
jgi:hypothetical protein